MRDTITTAIHPLLGFAEPVSSWLHLFAAALALAVAYKLVTYGKTVAARAGIGVFAFGAVFLFAMSGTYHLLDFGTAAREVLLRLDHAAIWVMIAGTITALHMTAFHGWWRWGMVGATWVAAITGLVLKTVFFEEFSEGGGLALYLGMGWLGFISFARLTKERGFHLAEPILAGGVIYTAGAIVDFLGLPTLLPGVVGPHELFHLAVIVGAALHAHGIAKLARMSQTPARVPLEVRRDGVPEAHQGT